VIFSNQRLESVTQWIKSVNDPTNPASLERAQKIAEIATNEIKKKYEDKKEQKAKKAKKSTNEKKQETTKQPENKAIESDKMLKALQEQNSALMAQMTALMSKIK
jgi:glutaredoxin 2